jgi:hypothetical protein
MGLLCFAILHNSNLQATLRAFKHEYPGYNTVHLHHTVQIHRLKNVHHNIWYRFLLKANICYHQTAINAESCLVINVLHLHHTA